VDKLVQEVVRLILESIYEPTFSKYSHGFRLNRSCHTALLQLQENFTGVKWFVEGDIQSFFDCIDHQTLVNILRRRIKDEYFIALIWKFLKAGYLEDWVYHPSYSGSPQGSLISPILSNIYLNEFDEFMERYMEDFKRGKKRMKSAEYAAVEQKLKYQRYKVCAPEHWKIMTDSQKGQAVQKIRDIRATMLGLDYSDPQDSGYRRLFYIRYADDWICGVIGAKADAEQVKADIGHYLSEQLKLELSEKKTLITHSRNPARFLGYDVFVSDNSNLRKDKNGHTRRVQRGKVKLYVPREKWQNRLIDYGALKIKYQNGREVFNPTHRTYLISNDDLEILNKYNAEIRGMYNYYRIADNVSVLGHFYYVMKFSMFKTFGAKYKLHISQVRKKYGYKKFGVKYMTKDGEKTMYFYDGGFKKQTTGIESADVDRVPQQYQTGNRNGLIVRLKARQCEWCGAENVKIEIHHVRKLRDLQDKKRWEKLMIARKRKTMALCVPCHDSLHAGKLD
jgi:group II intron reverse transcriptase/maturase